MRLSSHKMFQAVAWRMLEQAQAEKELLVKHGLSEKLLDDLSAAIDEYDAVTKWESFEKFPEARRNKQSG